MVRLARRRVLVAAAAATMGGCMETPPDDDDGSDGADGRNATADNTSAMNESRTPNVSDRSGTVSQTDSETNATIDDDVGDDAFSADVWFQTDRVRSEINTFDVNVRVELRGSETVRVSAGRTTRTYNRSGTYVDIARVDLGTTVRAEAYEDGGWTEVNAVEVPVEGSASGF